MKTKALINHERVYRIDKALDDRLDFFNGVEFRFHAIQVRDYDGPNAPELRRRSLAYGVEYFLRIEACSETKLRKLFASILDLSHAPDEMFSPTYFSWGTWLRIRCNSRNNV